MRKAPCKNADQSNLQEAPVNPEGVREIIHPAPFNDKEEKYLRWISRGFTGTLP